GDEARFFRCMAMAGKYAEARASFESPRYAAVGVANLGGQDPAAGDDPHENLMRIIDNWIATDEAEKAAKMIDVTPSPEPAAVEVKPDPDDEGIDGEMVQ